MVRAACDAADAGRLVERALAAPPASQSGDIRIIAAGKAAAAMARAAVHALGSRVTGGVVIAPSVEGTPEPLEWLPGHHPLPTDASQRAGRRALDAAAGAHPAERLLILLSGGASAMMAVPAEGLTWQDKRAATETLLRAGTDIHALNAVRKHLSAIKGGQLAAAAAVPWQTLAVSDVVGDDLSVIASGPTVADASTFRTALDVIELHHGADRYPPAIVEHLQRGAAGGLPETPKPGDSRLARGSSRVIGSRRDAMKGAADAAHALGYHVWQIEQAVTGDARTTAPLWLEHVLARAPAFPRPLCVVSSGETTVRVKGGGRGGRNQEFALALVDPLQELADWTAIASVGTDGVDGPTDAAGAIVDSQTAERARRASLPPPQQFLNDNNAYEFFAPLGDLVRTGPSATNVGDLQIFLLA